MIVKMFVRLDQDKKADRDVCEKIRAVGVRVIARKFDISPGMVSLFAAGQTAMSKEVADKIVKHVSRVKIKK